MTYPSVRFYVLTCIGKDSGDWLIRIANLIVVQEWAGTGVALSHLVICSLLPKAVFAPVGGMLADRYDRRHLMVLLDALAGVVALGFLVALHYKSVEILFVITALRSGLSAIYYPVTYGLLPLMVPNNQDLQYAGTLATSVYGMMSMFGGLIAGSTTSLIGLPACYAIDSATYFMSSLIMACCVKGNFKASFSHKDSDEHWDATTTAELSIEESAMTESIMERKRCKACCGSSCTCNNVLNGFLCGSRKTFHYICSSGLGLLVFLKATDSLIWGPSDVISVEVATVRNSDGSENQGATAHRMGLYYFFSGFGVLVGPLLANYVSTATQPVSLQRSCVAGIFVAATGWFMASAAPSYQVFLTIQFWSGLGYGTVWAYSSLLLQILVDRMMLGRVLAIEYFLYVVAEALSSAATGPLYDYGISISNLCLFGAAIATSAFLFWINVHLFGCAAARKEFNERSDDASTSDSASGIPVTIETMSKRTMETMSKRDGVGSKSSASTIHKRKGNSDVGAASDAGMKGPSSVPRIIGMGKGGDEASTSSTLGTKANVASV